MNKQLMTYLAVGILTVAISFSVYAFFLFLNLSILASNTIATLIAMSFAFWANKIWVFRTRNFHRSNLLKEILKFASGRLFTYGLETVSLIFLVEILQLHPLLAKSLTQIAVVILNYVISQKLVFTASK